MAFRSASAVVGIAASGGVCGKPAGVVSGDLLVAIVDSDGFNAVASSGWDVPNIVTQNISFDGENFQLLTKTAGGSEPSDYAFTNVSLGTIVILAFSGYTGGAFVVGTPGVDDTGNSDPITATAPSITIPGVGTYDLLFAAGLDQDTDEAWPSSAASGMTLRVQGNPSGEFSAISVSTADAVASGATGTKSTTFTGGSGQAGWAAVLVGIPVTAGGPVTHPSTGDLAAQVSTVTGTSTHTALHASTGALDAQASTVTGTAVRTRLHPSTGDLAAQASTVTGTAARTTLHPTTGNLAAQASAVTGTAVRTLPHPTTGDLAAQPSTVAGVALRTKLHPSTGDLAAQAATVTGSADVVAAGTNHDSTGGLAAQAATVTGTAVRTKLHPSTGDLAAQAATVTGTAVRTLLHPTTGDLVAQAATVTGTAVRTHLHPTTGDLAAQAATVAGDAENTPAEGPHESTGALGAQPAVVTGEASVVSAQSVLDAKFLGNKNIKFKPLKKWQPASQEILPPEITNVAHIKPPTRVRTIANMLDDLLPQPVNTISAPSVPKSAPKPALKPVVAKSTHTPTPELAPQPEPVPSTPAVVLAVDLAPLIEMQANLLKQVEAMATELAAAQTALAEISEARAIDEAKARRQRNLRRVKEITARLLLDD